MEASQWGFGLVVRTVQVDLEYAEAGAAERRIHLIPGDYERVACHSCAVLSLELSLQLYRQPMIREGPLIL